MVTLKRRQNLKDVYCVRRDGRIIGLVRFLFPMPFRQAVELV